MLKELKTLKDISFVSAIKYLYGDPSVDQKEVKDTIKQEAIKLIKSLEESKRETTNNPEEYGKDGGISKIVIESKIGILKYFFNITKGDLK